MPDFFAEGVVAFRDGAYARARSLFEKAKNVGNESPLLYYNLGVTDYRLGYYPSAVDSFRAAAADSELAALAYYNLGLAYARMENIDEAARWFSLAQEAATDSELKQLAATAYARVVTAAEQSHAQSRSISAAAAAVAVPPQDKDEVLRFSIETSAGFTGAAISNQAAIDRTQQSDEDKFVALQMSFGIHLSPRITAELTGLRRDYVSLNTFDLAAFCVGLAYRYPLAMGDIRYGADFDFVSQGDSQSQRDTALHIAGSYVFSSAQSIWVAYRRSVITALDSSYSYVSGQRDLFEVRWTLSGTRRHLSAFGQYEYNDRSDYYEGNVFKESASPSRFVLGLAADAVFWNVESSVRGSFAVSLYGDEDLVAGNLRRQRRDETGTVQAELAWPIGKKSRLSADYYFAWNRSVISQYWYDHNQFTIRYRWTI